MTTYNGSTADLASTEHSEKEQDLDLALSGGINLKDPPHQLDDGQLRDLLNMYYPREVSIPQTRPGAVLHATHDTTDEVTAVHVYRVDASTSYVCYTVITGQKQGLFYISGDGSPVEITDDIGSLAIPSMATFNGCLVVAAAGSYLWEWRGYTTTPAAGVYATASAVLSGVPTPADTITLGTETWTWVASGATAFQINIAATAAECANNLHNAVDADSLLVTAALVPGEEPGVTVNFTARDIGTVGNKTNSETGNTVTVTNFTGGVDAVANHASGHAWLTDAPANDDAVIIGTQTWTWKTSPNAVASSFEVNIGTGATAAEKAIASAANLATAITLNSSIVKAVVDGTNTKKVNISARRIGTDGNLTCGENGSALTITHLTGGTNGLHLDLIDTYQAPKPGFIKVFPKNQLLIGAGELTDLDTVYFSAPRNHWQWATGLYGGGETFTLGSKDGTDITSIHPYLGQLVVHKAGQGREIYRIDLSSSDPADWTAAVKEFPANISALNSKCSVSVTDKHLFLDSGGFAVLTGTDTYDEVMARAAGKMVGDRLSNPTAGEAFFVVNPDEMYCLVFRKHGRDCWVFHYGTGRWARWSFGVNADITCGCYNDYLGQVMLGTSEGEILVLDSDYCTDGASGALYPSEFITPTIAGSTLAKVLVKQVLLHWRNIHGGTGSVDLGTNNDVLYPQHLLSFEVADTALLLRNTTALLLHDATMLLQAASYGRSNSFMQGGGEMVSIRVQLTAGAYAPISVLLRIATHGRSSQ